MLGRKRGLKKIEKRGKKIEEEVWGQEINLSFGWKANGNQCGTNMPVIPGNWSAHGSPSGPFFLFFCVNGSYMAEENEQQKDRHLYLIGQTPGWQLNWCHSSPEDRKRVEKEQKYKKEEGGWSARKWKRRVKATERGAWEVNLEQISIVTEQEGWMQRVVTRSG